MLTPASETSKNLPTSQPQCCDCDCQRVIPIALYLIAMAVIVVLWITEVLNSDAKAIVGYSLLAAHSVALILYSVNRYNKVKFASLDELLKHLLNKASLNATTMPKNEFWSDPKGQFIYFEKTDKHSHGYYIKAETKPPNKNDPVQICYLEIWGDTNINIRMWIKKETGLKVVPNFNHYPIDLNDTSSPTFEWLKTFFAGQDTNYTYKENHP